MKKMALIFFLAAAFITILPAQQHRDSLSSPQRQQQKKGFMDENGDGVNDRKMNGKRDRFIDVNGDGICDSREQGLGFRRGKAQSTHQSGKQQQRGKK
jgi:hypothetical protein